MKKARMEPLPLNERIRAAREALYITRSDACEKIDISLSTLKMWETGEREPSISQLIKAAAIYNVSPIWLLNGNNKHALPNVYEMTKDPMILAARIKEARRLTDMIRPDATEKIGTSISTLQAWEHGQREPSVSQLIKISETYSISLEYFFTGEVSSKITNENQNIKTISLNDKSEYKTICDDAGNNSYVAFNSYWIAQSLKVNPGDLIVAIVKGDSMKGVLNDGDSVLINKADKEPKEGIYLVNIDGYSLIKQIQRIPDSKIKVISTNSNYDSFVIDLKNQPNDFEIIGKVIWFGRIMSITQDLDPKFYTYFPN